MSIAPPTVAPPAPRRTDTAARAAVLAMLRRAAGAELVLVEDPGQLDALGEEGAPGEAGETWGAGELAAAVVGTVAGDRRPGVPTVTVHHPATYRALLTGGSVGLARSYAAGWWDTDDLVALLRLATRRLPAPESPLALLGWLAGRRRPDRSGGRADDRARDRADIEAHYDLGDDFFALFLDPTLTYSCALFQPAWASLEEAQVAKLDRLCRKLALAPGDEVLEIGSGWGSFAVHAATHYGCRVTTTTLSSRQAAHARRRVAAAGLGDRVTVLGCDYRDLTGRYDKLVSIEMVEAVGWRQLDRFFATCAGLLRPGGAMALQAIVIDDRYYERAKRTEDFVKAMVFPGATIPSVAALVRSIRRAGLVPVDEARLGRHYAETLAHWRARFGVQRHHVAALGFDQAFVRLWDLYLAYCQAGFTEGRLDDVQLLLAKPDGHPPVGAT